MWTSCALPASSRDQSFSNFRFGVIGRLVPFNKGGVFLGSLQFYDFLVYAFSFMEFFMVVELNVGTRDVARLRFSDYFKVQILLRKSEKKMSPVSYTKLLIERGDYFRRDTRFRGSGWRHIQMKHCSAGAHSRGSLFDRVHNLSSAIFRYIKSINKS